MKELHSIRALLSTVCVDAPVLAGSVHQISGSAWAQKLELPQQQDPFYLGIDNGPSGGMAALNPEGQFFFLAPVNAISVGKRRMLDVFGNLALLENVAHRVGGKHRLVVVCEKHRKNPGFGAKGNYAIGQSAEFWRVLLTFGGFSFTWADARTWQTDILSPVRANQKKDPGTKQAAKLYLEQRHPEIQLKGCFNAEEISGIQDAMCIAIWARANRK